MKTIAGEVLVVSLMCADFLWLMPRIVEADQISLTGAALAGTNGVRNIQNAASPISAADEKNERLAPISASQLSTNSSAGLIKQNASKPTRGTVRNNKKLTLAANSLDLEIATKLRDALSRDLITRSWTIAVSVVNGVVFLSGTALSEEESTRAADLALNISGVRQVSNGLQIPQVNRYGIRYPNQRTVPASKSYTPRR